MDAGTPSGRAVAAITATLAELELELAASAVPHPANPAVAVVAAATVVASAEPKLHGTQRKAKPYAALAR